MASFSKMSAVASTVEREKVPNESKKIFKKPSVEVESYTHSDSKACESALSIGRRNAPMLLLPTSKTRRCLWLPSSRSHHVMALRSCSFKAIRPRSCCLQEKDREAARPTLPCNCLVAKLRRTYTWAACDGVQPCPWSISVRSRRSCSARAQLMDITQQCSVGHGER